MVGAIGGLCVEPYLQDQELVVRQNRKRMGAHIFRKGENSLVDQIKGVFQLEVA